MGEKVRWAWRIHQQIGLEVEILRRGLLPRGISTFSPLASPCFPSIPDPQRAMVPCPSIPWGSVLPSCQHRHVQPDSCVTTSSRTWSGPSWLCTRATRGGQQKGAGMAP